MGLKGRLALLLYCNCTLKNGNASKTFFPLRRQLVRWPPACEDMSQEAEERPLLEDVIKQRTEDV
jgi:hypothetical protein